MLAGFPLLAALLAPSDGVEAVARWMHELDGRVPEARAIVMALAPHGETAAEALAGLLGEEALPGWQRTLATVPSACASQLAEDATSDVALRAFGIAVASRFGDDQAVAPLLALCLAGASKSLDEDAGVDRFATSLCHIAEREPHALGSSTLDRVPQEWRAPLAARLGRSARPEAAPWLLSLLSGDPTVEPTALLALARLARALEGALVLDEVQERRVLFCLDSGEATTRSAAAQAVGRLDLVEAAPLLVERLRDPSPSVRSAAAGALGVLTDLRLGNQARAWDSWLTDQQAWWHERGETILQELSLARGSDLTHALRAAATARLHRRVLGPAIARRLEDQESGTVEAALAALEALRPRCCRASVERVATTHSDPRIAARARRLAARLGADLSGTDRS